MNHYDCVIIGGGIAGLTAAIYLSRFHCKICVVDNKQSRAALIPRSHNYPAFPNGISGKRILARLNEQYSHYPNELIFDTALIIKKMPAGKFIVKNQNSTISAEYIIIATGVIDIEPDLPGLYLALQKGLLRHCLICDAFEVTGQKIGVIGNSKKALHAAFLLSRYSSDVTLINLKKLKSISLKEQQFIEAKKIRLINDPILNIRLKRNVVSMVKTAKTSYPFDTLYSALGIKPRSDCAIELGVKLTKEKLLIVNSHQETNIPGVYAVGDIVPGLNQMCVASSQAIIAAVAIFNQLNYK